MQGMRKIRSASSGMSLLLTAAMALAGFGCAGVDDSAASIGEADLAVITDQGGGPLAPNPPPLSQANVPQPVGGDIVNQAAAVRLGKAFFWDIQVGGDGQTACASCHFQAGADNRTKNTVHPGVDGLFQAPGVTGPGQTWNGQSIATTSDDRIGSSGVVGTTFTSINANPNVAADNCSPDQTAPFGANRRVTGRNAPSIVAAAFFRDTFWDGRANHSFNGLNPFGSTGNNNAGSLTTIGNGSLASQAVGPANNEVEMSCLGRPFNGPGSLASKLLARVPLGKQLVSATDGVLGTLSNAPSNGLKCGGASCTYTQLISAAFGATLAANAQAQFSRIWGQAIQAYEATLIPDQTPLDKFLAGNTNAMTSQQKQGWDLFRGDGQCIKCHAGSELSDATVSFASANGLINFDGGDQGFHNLGVRPTSEDLGRGAAGPLGVKWSVSGSTFDNGAFKTPALRNVKLTAPYMHNGGIATLGEVVDFYKDRGSFDNNEQSSVMHDVNVSGGLRTALTDFLTNALTDCRTEKQRAPFDHPSLPLPNGTAVSAVGAAGLGSCP